MYRKLDNQEGDMKDVKALKRRLRRARRAWHTAKHSGEELRTLKLTGEAGRIRLELTKARCLLLLGAAEG